jgi:hypothetical protein
MSWFFSPLSLFFVEHWAGSVDNNRQLNQRKIFIMSLVHQKKLQSIQEKIKTLQEEKVKTEQVLGQSLLKAMNDQQALSLDINTLIGGLLFVIKKIQEKDKICHEWQKEGLVYFNQNKKKK